MRNVLIGVALLFAGAGLILIVTGLGAYRDAARPWRGAFVDIAQEDLVGRPPLPPGRVMVFESEQPVDFEFQGSAYASTSILYLLIDTSIPESDGPESGQLKVEQYGEETFYDLAVGTPVVLDGRRWTIVEVRKWAGLLRDGSGTPMVSFSLLHGDDVVLDRLDLNDDSLAAPEGMPKIHIRWYADEAGARAAAEDGLAVDALARWGVQEGSAVHWFSSFRPGTGVELADGSLYRLVAFEERDAADGGASVLLEVEVETGERKERLVFDRPSESPPVYFEYPSLFGGVFTLRAWKDGESLVAYRGSGGRSGPRILIDGQTWWPDGAEYALRLEQVMATGVRVSEAASPFQEVVLEGPDRRVRVRQGEAVRVGDALLRYVRKVDPTRLRHAVTAISATGEETDFTLNPGEEKALDTLVGKFTLAHGDIRGDEGAVLRSSDVRFPAGLMSGLFLVLSAPCVFLIARRGVR